MKHNRRPSESALASGPVAQAYGADYAVEITLRRFHDLILEGAPPEPDEIEAVAFHTSLSFDLDLPTLRVRLAGELALAGDRELAYRILTKSLPTLARLIGEAEARRAAILNERLT